MGKINYTKGEWKVGKSTDALGYETPIYANTEEGRDYEIATVHIYSGEQIANAQLIASAPDLYEALRKAQEDINWMLNNGKFLNPDVFDYIDKALAKAEMK